MCKSLAAVRLSCPLAVLQVATTGDSPDVDRIVEIAVVKFMPEGDRARLVRRVNPGIPHPRWAAVQNRISDPPFKAIASPLVRFLRRCDLCGANIKRFALPFLVAEFARASIRLPLGNREVIDVLELDLSRDHRDLAVLAVAAVLEARLSFALSHKPGEPGGSSEWSPVQRR